MATGSSGLREVMRMYIFLRYCSVLFLQNKHTAEQYSVSVVSYPNRSSECHRYEKTVDDS